MTQKLDVELAIRRLEAYRHLAAIDSEHRTFFQISWREVAKFAEDLELVLETLHKKGFAYDR